VSKLVHEFVWWKGATKMVHMRCTVESEGRTGPWMRWGDVRKLVGSHVTCLACVSRPDITYLDSLSTGTYELAPGVLKGDDP
jgi:hypothetical protein